MSHIQYPLFVLVLSLFITACSSNQKNEQASNERLCASANGNFYPCSDLAMPQTLGSQNQVQQFDATGVNFRLLNEYTEQMAGELYNDIEGMTIDELILVASFVYFDTTLQKTSHLGNQLAEYFINDLQHLGLPVSDHKLRTTVQVNELGDFALSRQVDELNNNIQIGYVLTGTMVHNNRGVVVNARITNHKTNRVIASTSKFIPHLVTADL